MTVKDLADAIRDLGVVEEKFRIRRSIQSTQCILSVSQFRCWRVEE